MKLLIYQFETKKYLVDIEIKVHVNSFRKNYLSRNKKYNLYLERKMCDKNDKENE